MKVHFKELHLWKAPFFAKVFHEGPKLFNLTVLFYKSRFLRIQKYFLKYILNFRILLFITNYAGSQHTGNFQKIWKWFCVSFLHCNMCVQSIFCPARMQYHLYWARSMDVDATCETLPAMHEHGSEAPYCMFDKAKLMHHARAACARGFP